MYQSIKSWAISDHCDSGGKAGEPGPDHDEHVAKGREVFLDNEYPLMKAHAMFLSGAHILALKDTCVAVIQDHLSSASLKEPAVSLFESKCMEEFLGNCRIVIVKV